MLTLYLARHGESTCSSRGVLCGGECDADLTARGEQEARALAARYGAEVPAAIYSSPQRRARETALVLGEVSGIGVSPEERLREITYGAWDGARRAQLPADELARFTRGVASAPEGESLAEVRERVSQVLLDVRARHRRGAVWLVSHHTTLRLLLGYVLGAPPAEYRRIDLAPASVSVLSCAGDSVRLAQLGLVDHLRELRPAEA